MTESNTPAKVATSAELGPLPETAYVLARESDGYSPDRLLNEAGYTADQMLAYASASVAAERERWQRQAQAMHKADDAYGSGFYNGLKWRQHYAELRRMCGMDES